MPEILTVARYMVFAVVTVAAVAALASWLVRTQRISPFSGLGRVLRSASDRVLGPLETRLLRMGGNPRHAGWWLVVVVAALGVLFLSLLQWGIRTAWTVRAATGYGPRAVVALAVLLAYRVLVFALIVRVVGSWFGWFRYTRWMRPVYLLTDWLVEPIRRLMPSFGAFDLSPLVALLGLWILKQMLLSVIAM